MFRVTKQKKNENNETFRKFIESRQSDLLDKYKRGVLKLKRDKQGFKDWFLTKYKIFSSLPKKEELDLNWKLQINPNI